MCENILNTCSRTLFFFITFVTSPIINLSLKLPYLAYCDAPFIFGHIYIHFHFISIPVTLAAQTSSADDDSKGPVFLKEPSNRIDFSNSTGSVVECRASGNPPPEIIWVRSDGTAVGDVPGLRQVLSNGNLVFPPFRAEDYRQDVHAQAYACLAKNQFGSIISRDVNVRAGKFHTTIFQMF